METGGGYDPSLERFDVAIRAAAKLARGGRRRYASQVGLRPDQCERVREVTLEIDDLRTEDGLFTLIEACPFLLGTALELLRLYAQKTALSRAYHHRNGGGRWSRSG